jgi:hypothetical protein
MNEQRPPGIARAILDLSRYPVTVLFLLMALSAAIVAWISLGLLNLAMANADFLLRHRLLALREGGLVQVLELALRGSAVLLAYLVFKGSETELIARWRRRKS